MPCHIRRHPLALILGCSVALAACGDEASSDVGGSDAGASAADASNGDVSDAPPTPGVQVQADVTMTSEAGGTATISMKLASAPTADVTIGIASDTVSEGTVDKATVTFTVANWNVAQTVTVTGADDVLDDGDKSYKILFEPVTSADAAYAAVAIAPLTFTNVDDDTAGVTVGAPSGHTTEAGGQATFDVVLRTKPSANVTIPLTSDTPAEGTIAVTELVFTPDDWNVPQTVTVTGVDDPEDDGDKAYQIDFAATTSVDPLYAALAVPSVDLTNVDDDTAGITVSPISGDTNEDGKTAAFSVVLDSRPTADVTLTFASNDLTEGETNKTSLVFTAANWDTPQFVTVKGLPDEITDGDITYAVAFSASTSADAKYAGLTPAAVAVKNIDNANACQAPCGWRGDDFEDGNTLGWSVASGTIAVATAGGGALGTARYVEVGGDAGHMNGARYAFTACQPRRFTAWVRPSSGTGSHNYIVLGDNAVSGTNAIALIFARGSEGSWIAVSSTAERDVTPIVPDVWMRLDIDFDWVAKTIDIDVNGTRRVTALPFRGSGINALSRVHLYNFDGGLTGRYDELRISCPLP